MKNIITSICLAFMLMIALTSKAGVYYVVSGESFTLTPGVSNLFQYQWTLDRDTSSPTVSLLDQASGGVYTKTLTLATATAAESHKLSLGVVGVENGCLSDVVDHTIIVLPKITVSILADHSNFCTNKPVAATLTASKTAVTLGSFGVTISDFIWSKGSTVLDGETASTLVVDAVGTYKATVTYLLPDSGTYQATGSKLTNAITAGTQEILNNLPVAAVPTITIN